MSGIFNLFGATDVTPRTHKKSGSTDAFGRSSVKSNAFGASGGPLKQGNTPKPKGLSIRSTNILNVCTPSQKTLGLAKGKGTLDSAMRPCTPRQKETVSKLQIVREKQLKSLSPTSKSPFFNLTIKQKGTDDLLFKKPVTPKSNERKRFVYPEPESIPNDIDDNFWSKYDLEDDLKVLKQTSKAKSVLPYTDEGFESDPEIIPTPPMSPIESERCKTPMSDIDLDAPEIPIICDSDDDF